MQMLHVVLQILTIALVLGANIRRKHMKQDEQAAFDRLSNSFDALKVSHEAQKAKIVALTTENEGLKSQLANAPVDDSPEVVAAANALADKVDAEVAADAPAPTPAAS